MGAELGHSCLPVGVAAAEEGPSTPTLPCRTEESPPLLPPLGVGGGERRTRTLPAPGRNEEGRLPQPEQHWKRVKQV